MSKIQIFLIKITLLQAAFILSTSTMEESETQELEKLNTHIAYGHASSIGRRETMDDTFIIEAPFFPEQKDSALFAIFDGHNGDAISKYLASNLTRIILRRAKGGRTDYQNILSESLAIIDNKLEEKKTYGGSTVIAVLKVDNKLFIANIGDSRAILSREGIAIAITIDHRPNDENERIRIENAGGRIKFRLGALRVEGILSLTRAIGDFNLREKGLISVPDIKIIELQPRDEFLILACDGIFERTIDCQVGVDFVKKALEKYKAKPNFAEIAAKILINAAFEDGSCDNLSVIVILFNQKESEISKMQKTRFLKNQITELAKEIEICINLLKDSNNQVGIQKLNKKLRKISENIIILLQHDDHEKIAVEINNQFNNLLALKKLIADKYNDEEFNISCMTMNDSAVVQFSLEFAISLEDFSKQYLEKLNNMFEEILKVVSNRVL